MADLNGPQAATAAATVFNIPELLENVLLHVDPFQLYVLQAVNSTFRSVIVNTKPIRKRMHLEQSKPYHQSRDLRHFLRDKRITAITQPFTITWHPACHEDLDVELSCKWSQDQESRYRWNRFWRKEMACMQPGSWRGIRIGQPEVFPIDEWDCVKTVDICGFSAKVHGETLGEVMGEAVGVLRRKPGKCACSFSKWTGRSSRDSGLDWKISSERGWGCGVM